MDALAAALGDLLAQQPALAPVATSVAGGLAIYSITRAVVSIVTWAGKVTNLLGNHLRSDLGEVKDELTNVHVEIRELRKSTDEQTKVLRAIGRSLHEARRNGSGAVNGKDLIPV